MKRNRKQIQSDAMSILQDSPGGIRWSELLSRVWNEDPDTPYNSVHGGIHHLLKEEDRIVKVARGIYRLRKFDDEISADDDRNHPIEIELADHRRVRVKEEDFYDSFAAWLVEDAQEVTSAVKIGGSVLRGKWGTPDVIGVFKPRTHDLFKFEPQIVSAEIKIDPAQPVTAFGQAVAYRLFSHKSYIVVPETTSEDDFARLKALCTVNGVGLVRFKLDLERPDFTAIVLPVTAPPDMFYTNQVLRRLLDADRRAFDHLF